MSHTQLANLTPTFAVIGHSGAGTCIEVLEARRPLIVCINDSLADNHQIELARQLADDGHLVYCTPLELAYTLQDFQSDTLVEWTKGKPKRFARCDSSFFNNKKQHFQLIEFF